MFLGLGNGFIKIYIILKDVPGALAKVCRVLADANVNIKTSSSFYMDEYPEAGAKAGGEERSIKEEQKYRGEEK